MKAEATEVEREGRGPGTVGHSVRRLEAGRCPNCSLPHFNVVYDVPGDLRAQRSPRSAVFGATLCQHPRLYPLSCYITLIRPTPCLSSTFVADHHHHLRPPLRRNPPILTKSHHGCLRSPHACALCVGVGARHPRAALPGHTLRICLPTPTIRRSGMGQLAEGARGQRSAMLIHRLDEHAPGGSLQVLLHHSTCQAHLVCRPLSHEYASSDERPAHPRRVS